MLERIQVAGYTRYKTTDPIPDGIYYRTSKRLHLEPQLKSSLAAVAAQDKNGRFCWLIPYEPWVKRHVESYTPPEASIYGNVDLNDKATVTAIKGMFKITDKLWSQLRTWHKKKLGDVCFSVHKTGQYRRGEIAPLGAGKTLFGLCVAQGFESPVVLAPQHLHSTWAAEADKWGLALPRMSTYESAQKVGSPDCLIMDEVLAVMNPATQRHVKARVLASGCKCVIGYTATPSSTNPMNLRWLRTICPGCVPEQDVAWRHLFGLDTKLEEVVPGRKAYVTTKWKIDEVTHFVEPYCGVVTKEEIAAELPNVSYQRIYVERPKQFKLIVKGAGTENGVMKKLAQTRQLSDGFFYNDLSIPTELATEKIDAVEELVRSTEEPVVVYAAWDNTVDRIASRLASEEPAVLRGNVGSYGDAVDRFVSGQTRVLIANTRISTGMNLQRSRIMVVASNDLNPINRTQMIGRIVRPGQKHAAVTIYDIIAKDTLDEVTLEALTAHGADSESIVESRVALELEKLK